MCSPQTALDLVPPFPPLPKDIDEVYIFGMQIRHRFRIVMVSRIGEIQNHFLAASSSV
jgi:hypothetical protein